MNKGKSRTRKLTIRAKILIPSILIIVFICALMGYNSYTRFKETTVKMGVEEADTAATVVLDSLDASLVSQIMVGSEDTQIYKDLQEELRKKQQTCGIAESGCAYIPDRRNLSGFGNPDSDTYCKQDYKGADAG